MLRASLLSSRALTSGSIAARSQAQWLVRRRVLAITRQRYFADINKPGSNTKGSIADSKPAALPPSETNTGKSPLPPSKSASASSVNPVTSDSSTVIPPEKVPRTPPPPPAPKIQTSPTISIPPTVKDVTPTTAATPPTGPISSQAPPIPPTPPPSPPKRSPRRFRRFLLMLALLTGLGYTGGVYYSLVSDNFHDFFTEYVPFGEDVVLYFEEREFRKRFPNVKARISGASREPGEKVTIPSRSGVTWRVMDGSSEQKGRHVSALGEGSDSKAGPPAKTDERKDPERSTVKSSVKEVEEAKTAASPSENKQAKKKDTKSEVEKEKNEPPVPAKTEAKAESEKKPEPEKKPELEKKAEPEKKPEPVLKPVTIKPIDPLNIKDANEPVVQDLVKVINNIITVVNADNAGGKFSSAIETAKSELASVGAKISAMKDAEKQAAEKKIKETHEEFDKAARELVRRLEEEMRSMESHWKEEFESEREKISQTYKDKLETELDCTKEVAEKQHQNELLEQAIEMKRKFIEEVKARVEEERNGRLGKLNELSSNVTELEKLTSDWNTVIDANLKTQQLHVAVETVRATLENADRPRPFVRELAALKEIARDDPVVNAAIASVNPIAYQKGVATPAQLVDRFRRVADEVRKASLLPEDAGVTSHAASLVLSKLLFKKKGLAAGDDVESILTRTETLLEEGDLDGAAREMNGLKGWAKTLSRDWLAEVRRALEVKQALDVIATEARLQSLLVE